MLRYLLFFLLLFPFVIQANVYRWTDKAGNVYFSDKPHDGAKKVELPEPQVYKTEPLPADKIDKADKEVVDEIMQAEELANQGYKVITITKPTQDGTVRNNIGLVDVAVELDPPLAEGDKLVLFLDNVKAEQTQKQTHFTLYNVHRGAHRLQVKVLDKNNRELAQSNIITFYMHRARV